MKWNWQQKDWPGFSFQKAVLEGFEAEFFQKSGVSWGALKHINSDEKNILIVDLISEEALKTSEIEGEYLNRESLQSSIRRNFGLGIDENRKILPAENGISEMMVDLYHHFAGPLTHETLFNWHKMLTKGRSDLKDIGRYRTHPEPMQVISGPLYNPKIHFEAPPSKDVVSEMKRFIKWFNQTAPGGKDPLPPLIRAGIAHLYFVSIHPFEDGNGRIGRALSEKALSQCLGRPTLVALSHTIEEGRKTYYEMLEFSNKGNEITKWLTYFSQTILKAQDYTQGLIEFIIEKAKFYEENRGKINLRQEKVIARMFREGPKGFEGGLSAGKYISITKTSRATATRDLEDLVEKKVLIRKGERKNTRYYLNLKRSGG